MPAVYVPGSSGKVAGGSTALTTLTLTLPAAVPTGAAVCVFWYGDASGGALNVGSITDNGSSNTYNNTNYVYNTIATGNWFAGWWYALNVQGNPTTVTWTRATPTDTLTYQFTSLVADVFTNVLTAAALDGNSGQQQNSTGSGANAQSSGLFSPATAGDLIWGAMVTIQGGTLTLGTPGFTQGQSTASLLMTEYKLSGVTGSQAVTFTDSLATDQCHVGGLALKTAAAASAACNRLLLGIGCSVGWRATLPLVGAWKAAKALQDNKIITRRRLILPK